MNTTTSNTPTIYLAARNKSGFCNHWDVFAFLSASDRDEFVAYWEDRTWHGNYITCHAIDHGDVASYVDAPKPFSRDCRCLDTSSNLTESSELDGIPQPFAVIVVAYPNEHFGINRLSDYVVR